MVHRDYADPSCTTQTRLGTFHLSPHVVRPGGALRGSIAVTCGRGPDGKQPCPIDWSGLTGLSFGGPSPVRHTGCGTYQPTCTIRIPKRATTAPFRIVTVGITNDQGTGISKDYFAVVGGDYYLLSGHLKNALGAPIGGAWVFITGPGDRKRKTTDEAGLYSQLLTRGRYAVTVVQNGLKPVESTDCKVVGESCRVNLARNRTADFALPPEFTVDVAARYDGGDHNGDKIVDYFPPTDHPPSPPLDPDRWIVTLALKGYPKACDSASTYSWSVKAAKGGRVYRGDGCRFVAKLATPGKFTATLRLSSRGDTPVPSDKDFEVKDLLIVSMGDSFGSGEGVPEATGSAFAWESARCHTSSQSGFALAARRVALGAAAKDDERRNIFNRVTFVHLACSGALAGGGINEPYPGIEPGSATTPLLSQLAQMEQVLGKRLGDINAIMLSIGGNDIGFSSIIHACALIPPFQADYCDSESSFLQGNAHFRENLADLNAQYARIQQRLAGLSRGGVNLNSRLLITEYPDFMHNDNGALCTGPGAFSAERWAWAYGLLQQLNRNIETVAARATYRWRLVKGAVAAFHTHGYCSPSSWMNSITDFALLPSSVGSLAGIFHPNFDGQLAYAEALVPVLQALLKSEGAF